MAINRRNRITPKDVEDVIASGYTLAQIAREAGIDRISLSKFRNHGHTLRAADQSALIAWLQKNELWNDDVSTDETDDAGTRSSQSLPVPARLTAINTIRYALTIDESIPDDVVNSALDMLDENDAELATLLNRQVETGIFSDFSDDSAEAIQQALAICALNYIVFRSLRGWRVFKASPSTDDIKKIRDVILETFRPQLIEAGLLASEPVEQTQEDQSEEVVE